MKIAFLTAGAAGMFCGSCMLDNALARAMIQLGHECLLVPLYTPIRTDEEDISVDQVFFGGINVYLQQKLPFLKWLPKWIDAPLNNAGLVRRLTKNTGKISMKLLGQMTVSMLEGIHGHQRKEAQRLCDWLSRDIKPDVILFSNMMIAGILPELKRRLDSKLWIILQGDDVFLDSLPEPYRGKSIAKMSQLDQFVDGYVAHSDYYAAHMAKMISLPIKKIKVIPLGIDTKEFISSTAPAKELHNDFKIGYFARLSREKGIDRVVEAFIEAAKNPSFKNARLEIAGYLGPQNEELWQALKNKLSEAGLDDRYTYHGSVDRQAKLVFLRSIDLLCVPTAYREPKGLFVLEAFAAGAPYLLPDHGAFPELHQRLNFGSLFKANDSTDLVQQLIKASQRFDLGSWYEINAQDRSRLLSEIHILEMAKRKLDAISAPVS